MGQDLEIKSFFENIKNISLDQEKQKKEGFNDYNLFTSLLKASDEVRLHSRFLYSLLNPKGKHYQGVFFLECFLKQIDNFSKDFNFNVQSASVHKEKNNIDLYITDGNYHIIIENKIYALDQETQIQRYIEQIYKDNPECQEQNILVIYLSLDREKPSEKSLGDYILDGSFLKHQNNQQPIHYRSLHYAKHIHEMIKIAHDGINANDNNKNILIVLEQYLEVIGQLNKTYKGKVMTFENYFELDTPNKFEELSLAMTLGDELKNIQANLLMNFFDNLKVYLAKKYNIENANHLFLSDRHILTKEKIEKWLIKKDKYIGTFFDVNHEGSLLYIQLAETNLWMGMVSVNLKDGKYTLVSTDKLVDENSLAPLEYTKWKIFGWYAKNCGTFKLSDKNYLSLCLDMDNSSIFKNDIEPIIQRLAKSK